MNYQNGKNNKINMFNKYSTYFNFSKFLKICATVKSQCIKYLCEQSIYATQKYMLILDIYGNFARLTPRHENEYLVSQKISDAQPILAFNLRKKISKVGRYQGKLCTIRSPVILGRF